MKLFRFKKAAKEETASGEIVIIDDTPENLHLLNKILSERGYKVRALPNGPMGLSACQASTPDLVLLDITMPGMDGYQVAEKLKADPTTRKVPIIFISAMSQTADKVRAFQAGGVDYVTKPLQVEEVMARVETHLSISRMRDQLDLANQKLLAWNVELSQRGATSRSASGNGIPERMAELFGKSSSAVADGDRADAHLSILAATSPSDETLASLEEGLVRKFDGCLIARFGGVMVGVSPLENDPIAEWLEESFESDELSASLGAAEGVLQASPMCSESADIRLDFRSPAVFETMLALANHSEEPGRDAETG